MASEESSSGLSGPECVFCGIAKPTRSASTSSVSGGRESRVFPTCAISWPTARATDGDKGTRTATGALREFERGRNVDLGVAVHLPCRCACHTSMSSAAGSPARTSVLPAPGQASRRGPARVFGTSSPDSFASYDPATSSWRTSQLSLLEDSTSFSGTWPRAGMTRNGIASRLVPLAPLTAVTAFGLLPTPKVPRGGGERSGDRAGTGDLVFMARRGLWPTPTKSDGEGGPGQATSTQGGENRRTAVGGQLNPTWVEWLMGYPLGWTVSEAWETQSFRKSRNGSAAGSFAWEQ